MGRDLRFQISDDDMPAFGQTQSLDDTTLPTNRNADHHTIVDMNLRTVRFVIVVVLALVGAFSYALLTSKQLVVVKLSSPELLEDKVAVYNVILGTTMFAASKVFEIYAETLIFPTLHTYLHNCSLYPGDVPQRVTSTIKNNCIFWGLKTVIILMNVGFASLYVSQRMRGGGGGGAVVLSVGDSRQLSQQSSPIGDGDSGIFDSLLHGYGHDAALAMQVGAGTCPSGGHSNWTVADVDYTSVSFGFPRRAWSEQVVIQAMAPSPASAVVTLQLRDCVRSRGKCQDALLTNGFNDAQVVQLLAEGITATWPQAQDKDATTNGTTPSSFDLGIVSRLLLESMEANVARSCKPQDASLTVTTVAPGDGSSSSKSLISVTVSVECHARVDSILCGASHCVAVVDAEPLQQISMTTQVDGSMITHATVRQVTRTSHGDVREVRSFAFASLGTQERTVGSAGTSGTTQLLTIHPIILPVSSHHGWTTWLPVVDTTMSNPAAPPLAGTTHRCEPLVDAYFTQVTRDAFHLSLPSILSTMAIATMLHIREDQYLPHQHHQQQQYQPLAIERRLASATASVKLRLSIPRSSAIATIAGCCAMVILSFFVIWRPTARVRLSPNTTPAAQYVQILTDDLYPDVVHKKRLRFPNGDTLPFNEYVVDSIVLHAKRDENKKIFLSA